MVVPPETRGEMAEGRDDAWETLRVPAYVITKERPHPQLGSR